MAAATFGGLTGRSMRRQAKERGRYYVSVLALLPLMLGPLEQLAGAIPGRYKAYTYIDIKASKSRIWPW